MDKTRVLVVSSDAMTRSGIASLFVEDSEVQIQGLLHPIELDSSSIDLFDPDVIVWDLGWETMETVPDQFGIPILVLYAPPAVEELALQEGVMGYLSRDANTNQIRSAIRAVHQSLMISDLGMTPSMIRSDGDEAHIEELSSREVEVLKLIAEGKTNRSIAVDLGITEYTVKFHVNSILSKLNAESRTEAAMIGVRMGIIPI